MASIIRERDFSRNDQAIHEYEDRLAEINIEQRFRRGELEHLPRLIEPVEAGLAQIEEPIPQRLTEFASSILLCFCGPRTRGCRPPDARAPRPRDVFTVAS